MSKFIYIILLCIALLVSGSWFLQTIHSLVLIPFCSLPVPFLPSSQFCRTISPMIHILNSREAIAAKQSSNHSASFLCSVPLLHLAISCPEALETLPPPDIQKVLRSQYNGCGGLVQASTETPQILRDLTDFSNALQDLMILVKYSELESRDKILEELKAIRTAGRIAGKRLLAYTTRLSGVITNFLSSSDHTIKAIESEASVTRSVARKIACALTAFNCCATDVRKSFLYNLKTFEILVQDLSHSNGLTTESLSVLEGHLDAIRDLVGYETHMVSAEIGDLLGSLWTFLGGNRKRIANAHSRHLTLNSTSTQTKRMKRLVLNVQDELFVLQKACDNLRAYAAHPLLLDEDIPAGGVLAALSEGTHGLRDMMEGLRSRAKEEDPRVTKPVTIII